jgi:hypothetical protein
MQTRKFRAPPPLPSAAQQGDVLKPSTIMQTPETEEQVQTHDQKAGVGHNVRKLPPPIPKPKLKSQHTYERPETASDSSCDPEAGTDYVKFSKSPHSTNPSSKKLELMGEQLDTIQTTLLTVVKQIGEIQTRQSAFEKELQAVKGSEHAGASSTITADMSPADVRMCPLIHALNYLVPVPRPYIALTIM